LNVEVKYPEKQDVQLVDKLKQFLHGYEHETQVFIDSELFVNAVWNVEPEGQVNTQILEL
jgi:hypothetical protein